MFTMWKFMNIRLLVPQLSHSPALRAPLQLEEFAGRLVTVWHLSSSSVLRTRAEQVACTYLATDDARCQPIPFPAGGTR